MAVATGMVVISALPRINKLWYVEASGSIEQQDGFLLLVVIYGLFAKWKYLKQLLIGYNGLLIFSSAFMLLGPNISVQSQPGWIINLLIASGAILILFWLIKEEKKLR